MAQVTITINSREYAIACEDGQEVRLIQLSRLLDEKAKMLTSASGQVNENMLLTMVGLLLADELTELKKGNPTEVKNDEDIAAKEQRIRELDAETADKIKILTKEIKSVASKIDLL